MRFRKTRRGIAADVDEVEVAVLRRFLDDLTVLLAGDEPEDPDPLAAMVGLPPGDPSRPEDPALARLLPDAYRDDPEASREFRRYTDSDLRAGKRANGLGVAQSLTETRGRVVLDRDQVDAWLTCLNDLRLVLGTRLEVTEDPEPDLLAEDDPRRAALEVYDWLGAVQDSLLRSVEPRR